MDFHLEKHNPWWEDKKRIDEDIVLVEFYRQKYKFFHPFIKNQFNKDAIFIIRGPRRIGKTTLIKLIIKKLLFNKRVNPKNIFFYPCDRIVDFNVLYDLLINFLSQKNDGRRYIFLDEITYVKEWPRAIKSLADSGDLKKTTLFLTGSNALDLKTSAERLPGRRGKEEEVNINFYPLSFFQFYTLTKNKNIFDFLLTGGFPQAVNEYYRQQFISNFIYQGYLDWIEGDIHKIGKSDKLMDLIFSEIFKHLGSTVSWYKIAKNTGIGSHSTVEDYIDIFDKLFITFSLNYYSIDQKKIFFNKNKKIYFSDPIILHSIKGKIDNFLDQFFLYAKSNILNPNFLPALMENIVASYLKQLGGQLFYGNYRGKEIDFVFKRKNKTYFIEVKYQNLIHPNDFSFWQEKKSLVVVTKNFTYKKDNLRFIKIEDFLLGELNLEEILV